MGGKHLGEELIGYEDNTHASLRMSWAQPGRFSCWGLSNRGRRRSKGETVRTFTVRARMGLRCTVGLRLGHEEG